MAWVVKRHFCCRCVSCPSKRVCLLLLHVYCYAGLADWNLWVRTEGCGHHVAWQQGKWDFLKGVNRDKQTLLKGTNNVLMQTQSQKSVFHLFFISYPLYCIVILESYSFLPQAFFTTRFWSSFFHCLMRGLGVFWCNCTNWFCAGLDSAP